MMDDEGFVIKCGIVFALLPLITFLTIYFWEAALILVVLALLTKISRMVVTVKRKLDKHMVDPEAHQDK